VSRRRGRSRGEERGVNGYIRVEQEEERVGRGGEGMGIWGGWVR
jgi:hypothetical protein